MISMYVVSSFPLNICLFLTATRSSNRVLIGTTHMTPDSILMVFGVP